MALLVESAPEWMSGAIDIIYQRGDVEGALLIVLSPEGIDSIARADGISGGKLTRRSAAFVALAEMVQKLVQSWAASPYAVAAFGRNVSEEDH